MEKKLKKVQRAASVGYVLLKILRILLIVAAVLAIIGLVVLAVVNENDLKLSAIQDGKLILNMKDLDLSQLGLDAVPNVGQLVQDGVLSLELKDAKLVLMLLVGAAIIALAGLYVLLLVAGKLFKHVKAEDTPFTAGNVRRLRLLGILHLIFWACGIVLSYFVGFEFIRRLGLPNESVTLNLNVSALLLSLVYFFLARVFNFGKAQGEALQAYLPASEPAPAPVPEPVYQAPAAEPQPVYQTPAAEPQPEPVPPVVEHKPEPVAEAVTPVIEETAEAAENAVTEAAETVLPEE